jgi:hypothetical protein
MIHFSEQDSSCRSLLEPIALIRDLVKTMQHNNHFDTEEEDDLLTQSKRPE